MSAPCQPGPGDNDPDPIMVPARGVPLPCSASSSSSSPITLPAPSQDECIKLMEAGPDEEGKDQEEQVHPGEGKKEGREADTPDRGRERMGKTANYVLVHVS